MDVGEHDREEEVRVVDSDDEEVFEINDFTNATPWEGYVIIKKIAIVGRHFSPVNDSFDTLISTAL